jgi:hypothetical protein
LDGDWRERQWDTLALRSPQFPSYHHDQDAREAFEAACDEATDEGIAGLRDLVANDQWPRWLYVVWSLGVAVTSPLFLYRLLYFALSVGGVAVSPFLFSVHLLDIAFKNAVLANVLLSVIHNGWQLLLTIGFTACVVYIYTVRTRLLF